MITPMRYVKTNALELARRHAGLREIPGAEHNPLIIAMFERAGAKWIRDDEQAWCAAFAYFCASELGLQVPPKPAVAARRWLLVGTPVVPYTAAEPGLDVVVFKRGTGKQPGPDVIAAPGHVAFFEEWAGADRVRVFGGNQSNQACSAVFPIDQILGIRRLSIAG